MQKILIRFRNNSYIYFYKNVYNLDLIKPDIKKGLLTYIFIYNIKINISYQVDVYKLPFKTTDKKKEKRKKGFKEFVENTVEKFNDLKDLTSKS